MVEIKERKETEGMVEGADGREEGVEMMAAVAGRECMERASGRGGSPEERRIKIWSFSRSCRKLGSGSLHMGGVGFWVHLQVRFGGYVRGFFIHERLRLGDFELSLLSALR